MTMRPLHATIIKFKVRDRIYYVYLYGKNSMKIVRDVEVFNIFALFFLCLYMFNSVMYFQFDNDGMELS